MSNVLKNITKKYKWLRFLNYKTTKLAVLSAALFGLCLSSGASFAKYRDENYGNGDAGVAQAGDVYFYNKYETFKLPDQINETHFGTYVVVSEFYVFLGYIDVKSSYSFSLEIGNKTSSVNNIVSPTNTYFHSPNIESVSKFFAAGLSNDGNLISSNVPSVVTNNKFSKFENNKFYFQKGTATMSDYSDLGTLNPTYGEWQSSNSVSSNRTIVNFPGGIIQPTELYIECYKIIVFVDMFSDLSLENSLIFYDLTLIQED